MSEYVITHFQSKKQEIPDAYEFVTNDGEEIEYRQIVRCGDCKYYDDYTGCCTRRDNIAPMAATPDGFCAWAERREP